MGGITPPEVLPDRRYLMFNHVASPKERTNTLQNLSRWNRLFMAKKKKRKRKHFLMLHWEKNSQVHLKKIGFTEKTKTLGTFCVTLGSAWVAEEFEACSSMSDSQHSPSLPVLHLSQMGKLCIMIMWFSFVFTHFFSTGSWHHQSTDYKANIGINARHEKILFNRIRLRRVYSFQRGFCPLEASSNWIQSSSLSFAVWTMADIQTTEK